MLWAKIKLQFEGEHCWPGAKGQVSFLEHTHRHMFYVIVWIEQKHNDRDIEYIGLKRALLSRWFGVQYLGHKSCEMIAEDIKKSLASFKRKIKVEVSEDNENGVLLE